MKEKRKNFSSDIRSGYLMLSPFLILFFVFTVLPVLSSVVLSFTRYDMVGSPHFISVSNYVRMMLTDDVFLIAVKNTLKFSLITGPLGFMLAFFLAWLINELSPKARSLLSFLFYSPSLAGNVYFVWKILFSGDSYGYINSWLLNIGFITQPIQWLNDEKYTFTICVIVQLWQSMGVSFLSNVAALQNASPQLYEAGALDGIRNRWQELWYITLPSMKSILLFSSVMQIQAVFSASAVMIELTGFPSVNYSTHTIVSHLIDVGTTRFEMGYASAISVFLFAMMALFRVIVGKILSMVGR